MGMAGESMALHVGESITVGEQDGGHGNGDFNPLSSNAAVGDHRGETGLTWGNCLLEEQGACGGAATYPPRAGATET